TSMTIERIELAPLPAPEPEAPLTAPMVWPRLPDLAEIYGALELGVRDYVRKNGFRSTIQGLSGGIDSALVATIAADALGPDRVPVVLTLSPHPSTPAGADAEDLVGRQGTRARVIPIKPMMDGYETSLDLHGIADENLQARIRGTIWMALSNEEGHLVL